MDNFLLVILIITLDKPLQMDLYNRVHNLPALNPNLGIQFSYILKVQYLVTSKHDLYATLLIDQDTMNT